MFMWWFGPPKEKDPACLAIPIFLRNCKIGFGFQGLGLRVRALSK